MKHIKLFEDFDRGGFTPLTSKQIKIAKQYIKEYHPYLNIDIDLSEVEVSSGLFLYKETYYDSLEEFIESHMIYLLDWYIGGRDRDRYEIVNGRVNVDGYLDMRYHDHERIIFKFGEVTGNFIISESRIKTLEGSPLFVGRDFMAYRCYLKNLIGSPLKVGGNFTCGRNRLMTLKGAPLEIGGSFDCSFNKLHNLKYLPKKIGSDIYVNDNKNLKDFSHVPENLLNKIITEEPTYVYKETDFL